MKPVCDECPIKKFHGKPLVRYGNEIAHTMVKEVKYRFSGKRLEDIEMIVVGESPGVEETKTGQAFVGPSGKLIETTLIIAGYDPNKVLFANACRCMIIKDMMKKSEITQAMKCCRPKLEYVIKKLNPKVILTLGEIASRQVMPTGRERAISKIRGIPRFSEEFNCMVVPTFHPAFCLRSRNHLKFFEADVNKAVSIAKGSVTPAPVEIEEIKEVDSIRFLLDREYNPPLYVAIDTETQGLDFVDPRSLVISYSISPENGVGYQIWLYKEVDPNVEKDGVFKIEWQPDKKDSYTRVIYVKKARNYDQKIEELRELLRRKDIKKIMMNGNYDLLRFHQLGIDEVNSYVMDIQLAMQMLNPDVFSKQSLENIQSVLFPETESHKSSVDKYKNDMLLLSKEDPWKLTEYACRDAIITRACGMMLRKELTKDRAIFKYYTKLAHPVTSKVLFEIEKNGIKIDMKRLFEARIEVGKMMEECEKQILDMVPTKVLAKYPDPEDRKLSRLAFVRDILFSKEGLALTPVQKTENGVFSTSKDVLKELLYELDPETIEYRVVAKMLEYRKLQKLLSDFVKGFNRHIRLDGRIHPTISKSTATGRTACSNPNLQTIPKRDEEMRKFVRPVFIADEGKLLVAIDYSQAELRWIAHESRDEEMLRVFRNGEDIHTKTALSMLGVTSPDAVDPETLKSARSKAKSVNFGIVYMMSPKGLLAYASSSYGIRDMTLADAEKYIEAFFNTYPGVREWQQEKIQFARKNWYCRTAFGFTRFLPEINSESSYLRSRAERQAVNTPIQSASNDTTLFAAYEAVRRGLLDGKKAKIVLFVHDELIFEVDEDFAEEFARQMVDIMKNIHDPIEREFGFRLLVPFDADAAIGKNLGEMQPLNIGGN